MVTRGIFFGRPRSGSKSRNTGCSNCSGRYEPGIPRKSNMARQARISLLLCTLVIGSAPGCATNHAHGTAYAVDRSSGSVTAISRLEGQTEETKQRLLALDSDLVTEREVEDLLSKLPAPRIITVHGGLLPITARMDSFARFLIRMGYPEESLKHPLEGGYTYGYYDSSDKLAGMIAWYYERDGLRPMILGHSLGGIQAMRVLHKLAGEYTTELRVWNPENERPQERTMIRDPFTGQDRPVVGLHVSYASAALCGGLARVLPNVWDMNGRLRQIPDSVEEFTGFQKGFDILGGDFLGYGSANDYHAVSNAVVRNVRLPAKCSHTTVPDANGLLDNPEMRTWIESYEPESEPGSGTGKAPEFGRRSARAVWAAEVWHDIKKHWVLELQHVIREGFPQAHDR
jgi:hypothetical protein